MDKQAKRRRIYRNKINCVITLGDVAGIGAEVTLKALAQKQLRSLANFILIGNAEALGETARLCKIGLKINKIKNVDEITSSKDNSVALLDTGSVSKLIFGKSRASYGRLAITCVDRALDLIKTGAADALITAPVNKYAITKAGFSFSGHTEYLAKSAKAHNFAMMLIGGPLRVVLVTRHIPLKKVPHKLTTHEVFETLRLTYEFLKKDFGILHPKIAVCGLNPHSGEGMTLGNEEVKIIQPAINRAMRFAKVIGPLSADTLFYSAQKGNFDAVVAMYHDQGLIPLKMLALHQAVNVTLGLGFVRTSPDHGTAYDIAGKNKANPGSMIEAIKLAVKLARNKRG